MKNKTSECDRRNIVIKELINDWDELNLPFKALIVVGIILFCVIILIAFFSNGGKGTQSSLEVVFRTTLASVFGFLLSSNIKSNNKKHNLQLQKIQAELQKVQSELEALDNTKSSSNSKCDFEKNYVNNDINLVQIIIALTICIISISVICILLVTNNLDNIPAVSQLRDLMCSSIGFLIGESKKK